MTATPADRSLFTTPVHAEPHSRVAFAVSGGLIIVTLDADQKSVRVHGIAEMQPFRDSIELHPESSNAVRIALHDPTTHNKQEV